MILVKPPGHSNCVCPMKKDDHPIVGAKCRPGCNSSMPSGAETHMSGYSWWDLYNVSDFAHKTLGADVFIFSMPLKGINLGPGSDVEYEGQTYSLPEYKKGTVMTNHWWMLPWELKGDHPLR